MYVNWFPWLQKYGQYLIDSTFGHNINLSNYESLRNNCYYGGKDGK